MKSGIRRSTAFVAIAFVSAFTLLATAQQKKPAKPTTGKRTEVDASAPMTGKEESSQPAPQVSRDGGKGGAILENKTLDGGAKVFRFGEVEVEGRLKSPQIVYFLRRVRAEFAAGDLGHRTFMRELSDTRNEPQF